MSHYKLGLTSYSHDCATSNILRESLDLSRYSRTHTYDKLINWGNSRLPDNYNEVINKPEFVAFCISKIITHSKLKVPTIEFTQDLNIAKQYGFPLLLRKDKLSDGEGITFINKEEELKILGNEEYYAKFYPSTKEYRVHIYRNKLLGWQEKIYKGTSEDLVPIRNNRNNYRFFSLYNNEIPLNLFDISIETIKNLSLDFGAIDILLDETKTYRVIEINSAPNINRHNPILSNYIESFKI